MNNTSYEFGNMMYEVERFVCDMDHDSRAYWGMTMRTDCQHDTTVFLLCEDHKNEMEDLFKSMQDQGRNVPCGWCDGQTITYRVAKL